MITIATIVLVAIMTTPVTAQMRMRGDYGRGHYDAADITKLSDLNLTIAQIKKLNALRDAHLLDIKPIRDQMYNKSIELKDLWLEQSPDHNKIEELQKELQTLWDKIFEKVTDYRLETMSILTAQQQTTLETYKARRGHSFGPDMQRRGGMRQPDY